MFTFQNIAVGLIILAAFIYVGAIVLKKARSTTASSKCDNDCGCGTN